MRAQATMTSAEFRRRAEKGLTEKEWQAQVVQFAKHRGWIYYHTWRSIHSPAGFPDLVFARSMPGGDRRIVFAELKRMDGDPTDFQREWLEVLGQVAAVTRGHVEVHCWKPNDWPIVRKVLM